MRFDPFENKIKEAADNHHPAYDEFAWRKMKKLLDQYMPEQEKKRRFLFLLPLILLLGGGTWLALEYSGKRQTPRSENQGIRNPTESVTTDKGVPALEEQETLTDPGLTGFNPDRGEINAPVLFGNKIFSDNHLKIPRKGLVSGEVSAIFPALPATETGGVFPERLSIPGEGSGEPVRLESSPSPETRNDPALAMGKQSGEQAVSRDDQKNTETLNPRRKRSPNRFFFFASLGADASFIREMGETRLMPGVGAGFLIRDRIVIRAGLFTARKVYSAKPSEYNLPANVLSYYPNLQRIDADCDVLELPLLVSYQFGRSTKQKWMATAGISSIFMKEEKYNYHFKPNPNSPEITRSYTLRNESVHHYSIATISMGYKRNLGKKVSLTAEPYIKMPLKGVGLGKVKLHSGGVMLTVGISPFGK